MKNISTLYYFFGFWANALFCISYLIFTPTNTFCQVNLDSSDLPIIIIQTDQEIQDEPKITASMGIINNLGERNKITDPFNEYDGKIGIEIRGSSSQMFDKKGYGIETRLLDGENNNVSLFGFPKENDWILNGPFSDKTMMRNALAYHYGAALMEYAPRTQFCEVIINGEYKGVYLFTEKIKRDKGRVKLEKSEEDTLDGFLIKMDKASFYNSSNSFSSSYPPFTEAWQGTFFQYVYPKPEDITSAQKNEIKQFIGGMEDLLIQNNEESILAALDEYLDLPSFIDYFLVNELSKNPDAYRLSTYLYRPDKNSALHFGPVWDYNLGFGNVDYCTTGSHIGFVAEQFNALCVNDNWVIHFWWNILLNDQEVVNAIANRWNELRASILSDDRVVGVIDSIENLLGESQLRNYQKYPILNTYVWPNYSVEGSYTAEVERLRTWTLNRMAWMDDNIFALNNDNYEFSKSPGLSLFPNPSSAETNLAYYCHINAKVQLKIFSVTGQLVMDTSLTNKRSGENDYLIPRQQAGYYFLLLRINEKYYPMSLIQN